MRQVGHLLELSEDARSDKYKKGVTVTDLTCKKMPVNMTCLFNQCGLRQSARNRKLETPPRFLLNVVGTYPVS